MLVFHWKSVYLEPTEAPNVDKATIILILDRFWIQNLGFSLEKCIFGAHRGVLHYVLRRELALFGKNANFSLEICVKARGGRAARCMGSVPVADLLASEARQDRTRGSAGARPERVQRPLSMPFPGRSIERVLRDLATPSNYFEVVLSIS